MALELGLPASLAGQALLLLGPTASGKSAAALELASRHDGEIISVDSCAIYRGMDIGSAKPSAADRASVKHHLIDILEPSQRYSAGRFFADANRLAAQILARGRLPILVGGTMMYFNTILQGLSAIPAIEPGARDQARRLVDEIGTEAASSRLASRDPQSAQRIGGSDRQRLVRAWEVLLGTGVPMSEWLARPRQTCEFGHCLRVFVPAESAEHRARLAQRLDGMLDAGFVDEVRGLVAEYGEDAQGLKSVGYRQLKAYVAGQASLDEAVEKCRQATWQLARRQMTWIRGFGLQPGQIVAVG